MNEATERGINTNLAFKSKKFITIKEEVDSIYLSMEELQSIYELNLEKGSLIEKSRDLFMLGAFTGLRYSDFSSLLSENIKEKHISRKFLK